VGGLASKAQAAAVRANLKLFEAPGGLLTSTRVTGNQWDAPFGWAPLQMIPADGLRRYGFDADADRVSRKFLALVTKEFEEHGTIKEKYDVQRRESDVEAGIKVRLCREPDRVRLDQRGVPRPAGGVAGAHPQARASRTLPVRGVARGPGARGTGRLALTSVADSPAARYGASRRASARCFRASATAPAFCSARPSWYCVALLRSETHRSRKLAMAPVRSLAASFLQPRADRERRRLVVARELAQAVRLRQSGAAPAASPRWREDLADAEVRLRRARLAGVRSPAAPPAPRRACLLLQDRAQL